MPKKHYLLSDISEPGKTGCTLPELDVSPSELPARDMLREELGLPEVSEVELVRYFTALGKRNYGIDTGFYPLGSCTMKYNPKWHEDEVIPWAKASLEFAKKESVEILKKMGTPVDWHHVFPQISVPSLLLIPAKGMLKLKDAEKILPEFSDSNAKIAFINPAGHNIRRDNFPAFMEAIRTFLAE